MSFIHSGSETRTYRISSGNKLDGMYGSITQHNSLMKIVLTSFDGDAENVLHNSVMYLQIASTDIYMAFQNWSLLLSFEVAADEPFF